MNSLMHSLVKLAHRLDGLGLTQEADLLDGILLKLAEEENLITKLASGEVFMHIGGPSGSGKSTLMEEIQRLYPEIICKDLDEFDEEATEMLNLSPNWKQKEYTEELAEDHFKIKQELLDDFIGSHNGEKLILVGIHSEGDYALKFFPQYKILLNTSPATSLERRIKRDKSLGSNWKFWEESDLISSELEESRKIIQDLQSQDYTSLSPEEVLNLLEESLHKMASYNKPRVGKKRWSIKYKKKINCSNPKGFSQEQYCRRKAKGGGYKGS